MVFWGWSWNPLGAPGLWGVRGGSWTGQGWQRGKMTLVVGEQSPPQAQAGAAIPSFPCKVGKLRTAPNSLQNNQTAEIWMENLGKQKRLYQG